MNPAARPLTQRSRTISRSGVDASELQGCVGRCVPLLTRLKGASLLVTGATGWFGTWLLDMLCAADDELELKLRITAVSREPERFLRRHPGFARDARLAWIKADVRHWSPPAEFTHIIHGAADSSVSDSAEARRRLFDTILDGTRRVLEGAGRRCEGVLLISSGAVYGACRPGQGLFSESEPGGPDPASPRAAYAEAKRAAEQAAVIASAEGVPVRIARCFAFVGPHMPFDRHFAIGNFIADAVGGREIHIRSDGRPVRSYLYMTDLVRALASVLVAGTNGRAYNVGSPDAVSIEALARCVDRVAGGKGVSVGGAPSDPGDRYVPDVSRLAAELGFEADVPLESAILRTTAWYRGQAGASPPS